MSGFCPVSHCATASPIAGECLNPWPEHADTIRTESCSGWRSMTNRLPRVLPLDVFAKLELGTAAAGELELRGDRRLRP